MIPVLSAFYFGSVEHYRMLAQHPEVIIDVGEHYQRQSYRTRTSIVGPNGVQDLGVPIERRSGEKMAMHSVGLSYAETWAEQHLHAIRSAYGKTPWFIHYIDDIQEVLLTRYDRLVDLDLATMRAAMSWLKLDTEIELSKTHVEVDPEEDAVRDLRTCFHPKKTLPPGVSAVPEYHQAFQERHGHIPRMSIIDLVCNHGPDARRILLDP